MTARTSPLLLLGLLPLLALPALADEERDAQRNLKKNQRQLQRVVAALADDKLGGDAREEAAEMARDLVVEVRRANNDDAAEFLVSIGAVVTDDEVFSAVEEELGDLTSDQAIGKLAEILAPEKRRRADEDEWKRRVLVARVFGRIDHAATVPPLVTALSDPHPAILNAAIRSAGSKKDRRVVSALIDLLGKVEARGGWEYHGVRQALVELTGEDYFTQERWQAWWGPLEATYDFGRRGEAREAATRERGPEEKVPTFFGSEIESNRLVFIIDTSGSMVMTDRPQETPLSPEDFEKANPDDPEVKKHQRIERAKRQTVEAIKGLAPTQRFNVIPFSDNARMWKPTLVDASEANKAEAIRYVEGLRDDGGTNTYHALERAFADPEVDTIYLLSDGAPMVKLGNPGDQQLQFAREEIARIMKFVSQQTRFRPVKVYTFGMDGPGVWHRKWGPRPVTLPTEDRYLAPLRDFMRTLAERTGGEYRSI